MGNLKGKEGYHLEMLWRQEKVEKEDQCHGT